MIYHVQELQFKLLVLDGRYPVSVEMSSFGSVEVLFPRKFWFCGCFGFVEVVVL